MANEQEIDTSNLNTFLEFDEACTINLTECNEEGGSSDSSINKLADSSSLSEDIEFIDASGQRRTAKVIAIVPDDDMHHSGASSTHSMFMPDNSGASSTRSMLIPDNSSSSIILDVNQG